MNSSGPYHGLFRWDDGGSGSEPRVVRDSRGPATLPCPATGRQLRVATVEADTAAICPSCAMRGHGGYVSFDGDLRMVYACPKCRQLVWLQGA